MPIEAARAVTGGKTPRQHGALEYSEAPVDLDRVGDEDRRVVDQRHRDDDQPGAAFGARLVVGDHGPADAVLIGHGGFVAGRDVRFLSVTPLAAKKRPTLAGGAHRRGRVPRELLAALARHLGLGGPAGRRAPRPVYASGSAGRFAPMKRVNFDDLWYYPVARSCYINGPRAPIEPSTKQRKAPELAHPR